MLGWARASTASVTKRPAWRWLAIAFIGASLVGRPCSAAGVDGFVTREDGSAVRGATVELSGPDTLKGTRTDMRGYYSLDVDAGVSYVMEVRQSGFVPHIIEPIEVEFGYERVNVRLKSASTEPDAPLQVDSAQSLREYYDRLTINGGPTVKSIRKVLEEGRALVSPNITIGLVGDLVGEDDRVDDDLLLELLLTNDEDLQLVGLRVLFVWRDTLSDPLENVVVNAINTSPSEHVRESGMQVLVATDRFHVVAERARAMADGPGSELAWAAAEMIALNESWNGDESALSDLFRQSQGKVREAAAVLMVGGYPATLVTPDVRKAWVGSLARLIQDTTVPPPLRLRAINGIRSDLRREPELIEALEELLRPTAWFCVSAEEGTDCEYSVVPIVRVLSSVDNKKVLSALEDLDEDLGRLPKDVQEEIRREVAQPRSHAGTVQGAQCE